MIELLVVVAVVALLLGSLLPVLAATRTAAQRVTCSSNLRQFGVAMEAYTQLFDGVYPLARPVAKPFAPLAFYGADAGPAFAGQELPELAEVMISVGLEEPDAGTRSTVYHCPNDDAVFPLSANSYNYSGILRGTTLQEQLNPVIRLQRQDSASDVFVMSDFDGEEGGSAFSTLAGSPPGTPAQVEVPKRHVRRNILFADGHVGFTPGG